MAHDGTLNFDTKIDSSGFSKGLNGIGGIAKAGIGLTTKVLQGATAGFTALGAAAIKVGSDFEAGMSQVQAISGASGEDLEKLKNKAKEMGATTKFSATESAEALNYMAMAGWKTEDMLGGLEGVMNLAAASGEDLATASDIVTDAMTALGMQASEAGHFSDVLAAAASNANTSVGGMGETFKYAGAMAGTLGYSVEDVALATGLMANAGIKGTMAGTSLNSIMTRLSTNTNGARDAIEELGVAFFNEDGSARSLTDVMGELREATADMTTEQKANFANTVAGMEAQKGLSAILNATEGDYNKLSAAIQNADGCALEMAETMQDNLQGQLTTLQSGLEGLGISLYETFQGTAKDVVKEAQGMVQQLQDAFNAGGLDGLVSAVGDVLAQIIERLAGAAPELVNMAVSLVDSLCEGLKSAPGIGDSAASLITSLVTGLASCVDDIWTTAIVLVGKMAEGIAAGAPQMVQAASTAIADIVECIADWLPDILLAGAEIIAALAEGVLNSVPTLLNQTALIISTLFDGLMSALPQITAIGIDILNKLAEGIKTSLPTLIPAAMQALVEFSGSLRENAGLLVDAGLNLIMTLAQSLIDNIPVFIETIPAIITNICGIINDNAPKLLASGIELIGKLVMGLIKAIPTLVANIPQIIEAIVSVFTAFNWLSLGKNIITFITNGVKSLATSIPNALKNIGQTAMGWLRAINWRTLGADLINLIVIGVKSLLTAIPNLLKSIGHTAVEFFKGIDWLDLGVNLVKGIIAGITGALGGLWSAVKELGSGILDGIKSFFGINSPSTVMAEQGGYLVQGLINGLAEMPDQMMATLDTALNNLIAWGQQMLSGIQDTVQNMVNSAEQVISQLPGKIWTHLVNVVTKVTAWGQQMLNTAQTATQNMISSVVRLISQLPGKIWTHLVNIVTKVKTWGQQMLTAATTAIQNMISKVISLIAELPGKIWTHLANVVAKVTAWGQQMLSAAATAITNMVSKIVSLMSELPGKVASHLSNVISKVVAWGSDLASKGAAAAKGLFDAVVNGVSGLPSKMMDVGKNIVSGIWNGISSGWDWLKGKVADLANSLLSSAKSALGINSPSTKFRDQVGKWLMPGVTEGIEKSMPKTLKEMKAEAGKLVAAMQGTVDAAMNNFSLATAGGAGLKAATAGVTFVEIDNRQTQTNHYHEKVIAPSEVAKNQREAFRNFQKGVK